ncbi:conserved hypothetical protein [Ricinus communis]|uniref:Uncharacterized protein n=1 Tax=Ricinus communis TaxID=3988 RepID=B9STY3_RICCO|nr:conserved hypothetical protein [Ricinus communis]
MKGDYPKDVYSGIPIVIKQEDTNLGSGVKHVLPRTILLEGTIPDFADTMSQNPISSSID